MKEIEDSISVLVHNHFPDFYKEEGDTFVTFVKAYYEWAQQTNNHIFFTRNLLDYRDIDKTIDAFLVHFKEKYLIEAPVSISTTRQNVKNSLDFYRTKGTERGTKLFFKEVFSSSDTEVYFPGKDILYASDGEWFVPVYLEVSISEKTKTFIGKQITGSFSGATAFVESVGRKSVGGKFFDVVFLSNVKGNFAYEEVVTSDGVLQGCPKIIGSLTNITIIDSGRNFSVGDVVSIVSSQTGKQGKARIDSIESSTGKVSFNLLDGGTGYRITTTPLISEKTLKIRNFTSSNVYVSSFTPDETIYQPLVNVVFTTSNTFFEVGDLLTFSNSTANVSTGRLAGTTQIEISGVATSNATSNLVIGTGTFFSSELEANDYIRFNSCTTIYQVNSVSNDTHLYLKTNGADVTANTLVMANGVMLLLPVSGNFALADRISNSTALISSYSNVTASGKFVGGNTTFIGLYSVSNTFTSNGYNYIYGSSSNAVANVEIVGSGSGATFSIGSLTDTETVYLNLDVISENNAIVTTQLTGTVTANSTSPNVVGTTTLFSTELYSGAYVKFSGNTLVYQVNSVTNNTFLSLKSNGPDVTANTISITNGSYLSIPLNCLQYGFPKLLGSNSTTIINNALTKNSYTIGTIASLSQINPGNNYSISPIVRIRDDEIVGFDRRNLSLVLTGTSGVFVAGEEITQDYSDPGFTLAVSGSNTAISITETITQQINNTSNSYGEVSFSNLSLVVVSTGSNFVNSALGANLTGTITSNTTSSRVNGFSTLFTSELNSGDYIKFSGNTLIFQVNNIVSDTEMYLTANSSLLTAGNTYVLATNVAVGMTSNTIFFVNTAVSNSIISISRGTVLSVSSNTLNIKRKTFNQSFTTGVQINGSTSGASANVASVTQIDESPIMGNNAIVNSYAGIVEGSISSLSVINSGFSYEDGEIINVVGANATYIATGYANLINQGVGEGFFKSTKGFLNSDKYIHDGYFYQFYSYQVKSPLPLNEYSETLKKFMHMAGTILFGNVFKTSVANVTISSLGVTIET